MAAAAAAAVAVADASADLPGGTPLQKEADCGQPQPTARSASRPSAFAAAATATNAPSSSLALHVPAVKPGNAASAAALSPAASAAAAAAPPPIGPPTSSRLAAVPPLPLPAPLDSYQLDSMPSTYRSTATSVGEPVHSQLHPQPVMQLHDLPQALSAATAISEPQKALHLPALAAMQAGSGLSATLLPTGSAGSGAAAVTASATVLIDGGDGPTVSGRAAGARSEQALLAPSSQPLPGDSVSASGRGGTAPVVGSHASVAWNNDSVGALLSRASPSSVAWAAALSGAASAAAMAMPGASGTPPPLAQSGGDSVQSAGRSDAAALLQQRDAVPALPLEHSDGDFALLLELSEASMAPALELSDAALALKHQRSSSAAAPPAPAAEHSGSALSPLLAEASSAPLELQMGHSGAGLAQPLELADSSEPPEPHSTALSLPLGQSGTPLELPVQHSGVASALPLERVSAAPLLPHAGSDVNSWGQAWPASDDSEPFDSFAMGVRSRAGCIH